MVSKFARITGGVEEHIQTLRDLLLANGHSVELVTSEDLPKGSGFDTNATGKAGRARSVGAMLWSSRARHLVRERIDQFGPDLIHYHSIYHQLSASVISNDVPSVLTAHDYKLAAPCYELFREGAICTLCVGKRFPAPSIQHRCVKSSRFASAACSVEAVAHHRRYASVARLVVPSSFAADILCRAGYASDKIDIVRWAPRSRDRRAERIEELSRRDAAVARPYVLFLARLTREKGTAVLLDAWARSAIRRSHDLVIAGDGPLMPLVRQRAATDPTIRPVGFVSRQVADSLLSGADLSLAPSIWPETFGLSAVESLFAGTPLVGSDLGALADFRGDGVVSLSGMSVRTLAETLDAMSPARIHQLTLDLGRRDLSVYTPASMLGAMERVYRSALES